LTLNLRITFSVAYSATLGALLVCALVASLLGATTSLAQSASMPLPGPYESPSLDPRDLSGVWWTRSNDATYRPLQGEIPFTAAGRKIYAANAAGLKAGTIDDPSRSRCLAPGPSRVMSAPYPMHIIQSSGSVTILPEAWHAYRQIVLGGEHTAVEDIDPTFMGESVGRWEGDTLVIDTIGLKDDVWLDSTGIPHSEDLHIVERIRKLPGGAQFENVMTFSDAKIFTRPWSARRVYEWRPDIQLTDYFCGDSNRDITWANRLPKLPRAIATRATPPAVPAGAADFSGLWNHKRRGAGAGGGEFRYALAVTADKEPVPLLPWAQANLDRHKKAIADGRPITTQVNRCLGFGMPDFMTQPYPYKFIQTGRWVVILGEADHQFRIVYLNQTHPKRTQTTWSGNSIGHWEGDTLVVETIGQNDRSLFSGAGIPKTEALVITERFRLVSEGNIIEDRMTVDDPGTFSRPWEALWQLDRMPAGSRLLEYMCSENERDVALFATGGRGPVPGGAGPPPGAGPAQSPPGPPVAAPNPDQK
jgi:hypothetical protein